MTLESKIEALLFWKGEPLAIARIAHLLKVPPPDVAAALPRLAAELSGRGVTMIQKEDEVSLGTAPELSSIFEQIVKDELAGDLSKASIETLTIVLYRGPVSKQNIDYIRGINSGFILRSLLVRGLVERVENPSDRRSFLYKPTFELLEHLGLRRIEDLSEYEAVIKEMSEAETAREKEEGPDEPTEPIAITNA